MPLGPDTVGRKLLWSIALPGLVVTLLGVGHFWREARVAVQDATQVESLALAEFVASTFLLPQGPGAPAHGAVTEVLHSDTRLFRSVADVRVLTPDGRVRWSRAPSEIGTVHPEASRLTRPGPETARSANGVTEVVRPLGGPECGSCHSRGEVPGASVLQMRMTEPALHQQLRQVFGGALGSMAVFAIILALVIALSLHFNLTRPLRRLSAAMGRAEAGDLLVRADVRGTDEIARLGAAFNQMLARLTAMKAEEIDTHRDLELVKEKLTLKDELEERLRELSLLFDVTRSLNSTLELDELLEGVTRLVVERLQIPEFSIMLVSAEGTLEVRQAWPEGRGSEGLVFSVGEGACGRAAQTHKAVYLPDVGDPTSIFARRGLEKNALVTGALLAVPMVHAGTLMGVVNFQRPLIASFSAGEIELLTAVADIAAAAVKNARLHAETVKLTMTDPLTGCPTAVTSSSAWSWSWRARSASARRWGCSWWTWTTSSGSMIWPATGRVTRRSAASATSSARACARWTRSRATAARSSCCSCPTPASRTRWRWRRSCAARWRRPSSSRSRASREATSPCPSACPTSPPTPTRRRGSSTARTRPSIAASARAATAPRLSSWGWRSTPAASADRTRLPPRPPAPSLRAEWPRRRTRRAAQRDTSVRTVGSIRSAHSS